MTFSSLFYGTSFAAGYLKLKYLTTMIWFDEYIGPKRSTATMSQFFDRGW